MSEKREKFIKGAVRIGTAITEKRIKGELVCTKPREWALLDEPPAVERVVRHLLECPSCLATATMALMDWMARLRELAMQRAVVEKASGEKFDPNPN